MTRSKDKSADSALLGRYPTRQGSNNKIDETGKANRDRRRHCTDTATVGWKPGCACKAGEPQPCVVLDPFAGTSTTGVVALRHGRHFVGIELSSTYCRLSKKRIATVRSGQHDADMDVNAMGGKTA